MKNRYFLASAVVLVLSVVVPLLLLGRLPQQMPVRWDLTGQPSGLAPRLNAIFIMPLLMALVMILFAVFPRISPKGYRVESFRSTYLYLMFVMVVMFAYFHAVMLSAALSPRVPVTKAIPAGVSLLLMLMGNVMGKIRRNFFVGIRTPWTLSDERVWNATHRFAGKIMVMMGLLGIVFTLANAAVWVWIATIVISVAASAAYSLFYSKQLERHSEA